MGIILEISNATIVFYDFIYLYNVYKSNYKQGFDVTGMVTEKSDNWLFATRVFYCSYTNIDLIN